MKKRVCQSLPIELIVSLSQRGLGTRELFFDTGLWGGEWGNKCQFKSILLTREFYHRDCHAAWSGIAIAQCRCDDFPGRVHVDARLTPRLALTWCRRHSWCKTMENKRQKNEENNENKRFVGQCSIVTCPVSSTPRRSPAFWCDLRVVSTKFYQDGTLLPWPKFSFRN